jgi:hypothetical protein
MISNFMQKFGKEIGKNYVVLIGSATQLVREGLEGYIGSLLSSMDRLSLGRVGCRVLPAPLVLLGGSKNSLLLKNLIDLCAWIRLSGLDPDGLLDESLGTVEQIIRRLPGETISWSPQNMKLPLNLPGRNLSSVAVTSSNLPKQAIKISPDIEMQFVSRLVNGLNKIPNLFLDCDPFFIRPAPTNSTKECLELIAIGGLHAEATSRMLRELGASCELLSMPNYRVSRVHHGKIKEGLLPMKISSNTIFVLQLFDSG